MITRNNYRVAGIITLLCSAWLFVAAVMFIYWELVPNAWIDDDDPRYYDDPIAYLQSISVCGIVFAPLPAFVLFSTLYKIDQRNRYRSKIPARLTLLSLCIAIPIGILISFLRPMNDPSYSVFPTHAAIGQSIFAALGVWLVLANMQAVRRSTLPRIVSVAGSLSGLGFAIVIYLFILRHVNNDLSQKLEAIDWIILCGWVIAMFVWSGTLGYWLLKKEPLQIQEQQSTSR